VPTYSTPNSKAASIANAAHYNVLGEDDPGAPHLVHESLRERYSGLVTDAYYFARRTTEAPEILDLGAGDGFATLSFLALGARVTAVDVSDKQLAALGERASHRANLSVVCQDVFEALTSIKELGRRFDVVVASSFLHHIPDYCQLLTEAVGVLRLRGEFLSFQDPLRYSTLSIADRTLN